MRGALYRLKKKAASEAPTRVTKNVTIRVSPGPDDLMPNEEDMLYFVPPKETNIKKIDLAEPDSQGLPKGLTNITDKRGIIDIVKLYNSLGKMTPKELNAILDYHNEHRAYNFFVISNVRLFMLALSPDPSTALAANKTINDRIWGLPTNKVLTFEIPKNELDHLINPELARI